jgi:RsiW-degrading membrane proteinase PrsW (M82 family)
VEIILSFFFPFLWIYYFCRKDPHPEPILWLVFAFFLGILSGILSFKAEESLANLFIFDPNNTYLVLISVFFEEFFKFLVIAVFIFSKKVFDEPIDAMIYMMFSAFGFAFIENFGYLTRAKLETLTNDSFLNVVFITALLRFLGPNLIHILSSSLIGFGYSFKVATRHSLPFFISFLAAIFLHFIFNFVIIKSQLVEEGIYLASLILPIIWSAFWVVIFELDYLSLKDGRKQQPITKSN